MAMLALVTLVLAPWRGPSLPTVSSNAVKYRLSVHGPAGARVQLHADGLPRGWVAAFCTQRMCSPFRYGMQLNDRGDGAVEFAAIRIDDSSPEHVEATIAAGGAKPVHLKT